MHIKFQFTIFLVIARIIVWGNESGISWGFFAHRQINRIAVFTLPPEIFGFYKRNIEFITEHAVDPDKRRYINHEEAGRHFIDLDRYDQGTLPQEYKDAILKFGEDSLKAHGIVPWHIERMVRQLAFAFKEEDYDRILRLSADLGHYVADANVPLHTTRNYNGQLTNQKGIHGFWESRLPELFHEDYDFFIGKARFIEDPLLLAWKIVLESYSAKDSVLTMEQELQKQFPSDQKYSYENRGASLIRVYSLEYSKAYHHLMRGMVERRMCNAILTTGSLWFTAWVMAGQPNLEKHDKKTIQKETEAEMLKENILFEVGQPRGKICE